MVAIRVPLRIASAMSNRWRVRAGVMPGGRPRRAWEVSKETDEEANFRWAYMLY